MSDHTLHGGRKYFCHYRSQAFSTEEILKRHIKDCFQINDKQRIIMSKKEQYVKFKNYEKTFMIYADFESILVPEDNESKTHRSLIRTKIKNRLPAVMAIN